MKMLKSFLRTVVCTLLLSSGVSAWWGTGHVTVAEYAYQMLKPQTRENVDAIMNPFYAKLPNSIQEPLSVTYPNASMFARLATLADTEGWHEMTIYELYDQFGFDFPSTLEKYANSSSGGFHFIDTPFPAYDRCPPPSEPNVVFGINALNTTLTEKTDDKYSLGLSTALLSHYVGDIHQPLHTITEVNETSCAGDRGGNEFCLITNSTSGGCQYNLHSYYDSVALKGSDTTALELLMGLVYGRYDESFFMDSDIEEPNPQVWADENYSNAKEVYQRLQQKSALPVLYDEEVEHWLYKQVALAAYRLSQRLESLFGEV